MIISGGQTGVDRGALDAAMKLGIPCGGWCPAGRRSESGPIPRVYPLIEAGSSLYPQRTRMNVRDSDATLIICSGPPSGGTLLTLELANQKKRPCLVLDLSLKLFEEYNRTPGRGMRPRVPALNPDERDARPDHSGRDACPHASATNQTGHVGKHDPTIKDLTFNGLPAKREKFALGKSLRTWLKKIRPCVLNIAGPRESEAPGIYRLSFSFLREILGEIDSDDPLRAGAPWPPPRPTTRPFDFENPGPQRD